MDIFDGSFCSMHDEISRIEHPCIARGILFRIFPNPTTCTTTQEILSVHQEVA